MFDISMSFCYDTDVKGVDTLPDISSFVQIIGSLGFPIVCTIYLFFSMQKEREQNAAQREADRAEHKQEMEKMTEALHNNTLVIQKLVDTLSATPSTGNH